MGGCDVRIEGEGRRKAVVGGGLNGCNGLQQSVVVVVVVVWQFNLHITSMFGYPEVYTV
jgi:hypothetical protein